MSMRVLRYEVPVDDAWHPVEFAGDVLHVAARRPDVVEFWALDGTAAEVSTRQLRVFGTGQPFDEPMTYMGTALAAEGVLVWHLFCRWSS